MKPLKAISRIRLLIIIITLEGLLVSYAFAQSKTGQIWK